eukprot:s2547_g3.t1
MPLDLLFRPLKEAEDLRQEEDAFGIFRLSLYKQSVAKAACSRTIPSIVIEHCDQETPGDHMNKASLEFNGTAGVLKACNEIRPFFQELGVFVKTHGKEDQARPTLRGFDWCSIEFPDGIRCSGCEVAVAALSEPLDGNHGRGDGQIPGGEISNGPEESGEGWWHFKARRAEPQAGTAAPTPFSGYGVGLPLSRLYAEYLGGSLHLMSMPNFGTHAYLFLQQSSDREEALPNYVNWLRKRKLREDGEIQHFESSEKIAAASRDYAEALRFKALSAEAQVELSKLEA